MIKYLKILKYGLTYENLMMKFISPWSNTQVLSDKLYIPSGSITHIVNKLEKKSLSDETIPQ